MHLSPHDCDLLVADLCAAPRAGELRAHAAGCDDCGARLRAAEAERAAFLVGHPPAARVAALLAARQPAQPAPWWIFGSGFGAVAAAAVLVLMLTHVATPETRLKGEALSCRLVRGADTVSVLTPSHPHPALEGDRVVCTAAPVGNMRHLEVWAGAPPERLTAVDLDGPAELPRAFAASGHGEMRLTVVRSTAPVVDFARLPDGAEVTWFALVLP